MTGTVTAVAVVHQILPFGSGGTTETAIDKRAVDGAVRVERLGLAGDTQVDVKHHGGVFQAVYVYADEDAGWWAEQLGRAVGPGLFGENLRTSGLDVTGAVVGERWQIGEPGTGPLLEVTAPRTPCETFTVRMQEQRWVKRFTQAGRPGAYVRVLAEGDVAAGDPVTVVHRPEGGVAVGDITKIAEPAVLARLLEYADANDLDLEPSLRRHAQRGAKRLARP